MKLCAARHALHGGVGSFAATRDQNIVRGLRTVHSTDNSRDLLRRFPAAVDYLGKSLPQRAVMIDFREAQIFKWKLPKFFERFIERYSTRANIFQKFSRAALVH